MKTLLVKCMAMMIFLQLCMMGTKRKRHRYVLYNGGERSLLLQIDSFCAIF